MVETRASLMLIVAACLICTPAQQVDAQACALTADDSVHAAAGPVYRQCAVDKRARLLTRNVRPDFLPSTALPGGAGCYRVQLEFVVDTTGVPETGTARVIRTNHDEYAEAVLGTLVKWRYESARKDGVPVRQIVRADNSMAIRIVVLGSGGSGRAPLC